MYSVIFSSRWDRSAQPHTNPLFALLDSFEDNTTEEEKKLSEFIIKFDDDDPHVPKNEEFDKYSFKIKRFTFDRLGGRYGLHLVQDILYRLADENVKFVQLIADDFVFTRPNFVSEILEYSDQYKLTGEEGMGTYQNPEGAHGYCPAFSTKIIDALAGTSGPHCNADGIATALGDTLRSRYGYEIMFKPGTTNYYTRTDCITSRHDGNDLLGKLLSVHPRSAHVKGCDETFWPMLCELVYRAKLCDDLGGLEALIKIHEAKTSESM
tara:strand:+ start:18958 stop:19755 length:798 start_codon:yes stop_codon:yes gene_type:complete